MTSTTHQTALRPAKFVLRGLLGGLALGAVAWLAVYRALGGKLDLNSGAVDGWQAGAMLLGAGVVVGLLVAGAAFVLLKFLAGVQGD